MTKQQMPENQSERFKRAAREVGADMTKDEFGRVIGGLAKPKPQPPPQAADSDEEQEVDD